MGDERLCDYVMALRKKRRWNQQAMADATGWHQSKVSRIERGQADASLDDLKTISRVFKVPIERLARIS